VAATVRPGRHVHLQGWGEPLLREDLPDLARAVAERGGLPSVTTNGTLLTPELADRLVTAGLDVITISLAGGCPEIQAGSRPGTDLAAVLGAFRLLREVKRRRRRRRPLLAASYEMTRRSIESFRQAVRQLKRAGAECLIAIQPLLALTPEQEANLVLNLTEPRDREEALKPLRRAAAAAMWRSLPFHTEPVEPVPVPVCREDPLGSLFIGASGDVSPCVYLGVPTNETLTVRYRGQITRRQRASMGNLHVTSLRDIWHSPEYACFRQAYLTRKGEATRRGMGSPADIWAPLPAPCRGCPRGLGH
jgi:MoaA/NifB/PqqE/SkfB family radical SAM enzyme